VQGKNVDLLNARCAFVRHAYVHIGVAQRVLHLATIVPAQPYYHHLALMSRLDSGQHIG
jgi:hypothetical protein